MARTYRCSPTLIINTGDVWTVKDGCGRPIERWEVVHVERNRQGETLSFSAEVTKLSPWRHSS